jgi:hypothetical protein
VRPLTCACMKCKRCKNRENKRKWRLGNPQAYEEHKKYAAARRKREPLPTTSRFVSDEEFEKLLIDYFVKNGWETEEWIRSADNTGSTGLDGRAGSSPDIQAICSANVESSCSGETSLWSSDQETKIPPPPLGGGDSLSQ